MGWKTESRWLRYEPAPKLPKGVYLFRCCGPAGHYRYAVGSWGGHDLPPEGHDYAMDAVKAAWKNQKTGNQL